MNTVAGILPKLIVFVICMAIGGTVAFAGVSALNKPAPVSAASEEPAFAGDTPNEEGGPSAWDRFRTALKRTASPGSSFSGSWPSS